MWNNQGMGQWKCGGETSTGTNCQRAVSAPRRRCFDHALPTSIKQAAMFPSEYLVHDGVDDNLLWCKYPDTLASAVRHAHMLAISSTHQIVRVIHKKTGEIVLTVYGYDNEVEAGPMYEECLREMAGMGKA